MRVKINDRAVRDRVNCFIDDAVNGKFAVEKWYSKKNTR